MSDEATSKTVVELRGVHKTYERGGEKIEVLHGLDLDIDSGTYVSLMGPSGSGKSTLLNLVAGLDRPTKGQVRVLGQDLDAMDESALADFRADHIGFVFQAYNLIPVLSAAENVELPLLLTGLSAKERRERAHTALSAVGLADRAKHQPRQLSGGQEQRVGIARAIVTDPTIIVADEPTGDLDRASADEVLDLFEKLHKEFDKTIVMVTHDPLAAKRASVTRELDKGQLR